MTDIGGERVRSKLLLFALIASCGFLFSACDQPVPTGPSVINITNTNTNTGGGTGGPQASPSPGSGASDVASLGLFNYGKCTAGNPGVLERGCSELLYTATPKTQAGQDAVNSGRLLVWTANGIPIRDGDTGCVDVGPALVCAGPSEFTFNRTVKRKSATTTGSFLLSVTLTAPDGKSFPASANVVVQ